MPLVDLDLEFEDEDEGKRKKNEAFQVDDELEFTAPSGMAPNSRPARPADNNSAIVTNISEAKNATPRPAMNQGNAAVRPQAQVQPQNSNASLIKELTELKKELHVKDIELAVKDAMVDFKVEILTDLMIDIKMLDLQVGQVLNRISVKHPESKQELLMIKKLLADFTAKKRK